MGTLSATFLVAEVLLLLPAAWAQDNPSNNAADMEALLSFKAALDDSSALASWDRATVMCETWVGVECDSFQPGANVLGLVLLGPGGTGDLTGMVPSATGEVPPTAARLSYSLKGRISWEALSQLSHLVTIDLDANLLTGGLPNYLPAALEGLSVNWNRLTGSLPPMLSAPASLKSLSVAFNELTGTIPPDWDQSLSSSFAVFIAVGNHLTGSLPSWYSHPSTQVFALPQNGTCFQGQAPSSPQYVTVSVEDALNAINSGSIPTPSVLSGPLPACTPSYTPGTSSGYSPSTPTYPTSSPPFFPTSSPAPYHADSSSGGMSTGTIAALSGGLTAGITAVVVVSVGACAHRQRMRRLKLRRRHGEGQDVQQAAPQAESGLGSDADEIEVEIVKLKRHTAVSFLTWLIQPLALGCAVAFTVILTEELWEYVDWTFSSPSMSDDQQCYLSTPDYGINICPITILLAVLSCVASVIIIAVTFLYGSRNCCGRCCPIFEVALVFIFTGLWIAAAVCIEVLNGKIEDWTLSEPASGYFRWLAGLATRSSYRLAARVLSWVLVGLFGAQSDLTLAKLCMRCCCPPKRRRQQEEPNKWPAYPAAGAAGAGAAGQFISRPEPLPATPAPMATQYSSPFSMPSSPAAAVPMPLYPSQPAPQPYAPEMYSGSPSPSIAPAPLYTTAPSPLPLYTSSSSMASSTPPYPSAPPYPNTLEPTTPPPAASASKTSQAGKVAGQLAFKLFESAVSEAFD